MRGLCEQAIPFSQTLYSLSYFQSHKFRRPFPNNQIVVEEDLFLSHCIMLPIKLQNIHMDINPDLRLLGALTIRLSSVITINGDQILRTVVVLAREI